MTRYLCNYNCSLELTGDPCALQNATCSKAVSLENTNFPPLVSRRMTYSNVTVIHVTACDCSQKKSGVRVEIFFENHGGKNLSSEQRQ